LGLSARLGTRRLLKMKEERELEYIRKGVERMQPAKDFAMLRDFERQGKSPPKKSAVLSALRALQTRIATLTHENETLNLQINSNNSKLQSNVLEMQAKYEESKTRVQQLLQESDEHNKILKNTESERRIKENRIRMLENENMKLRTRLQTLSLEIEEYKLRTEDRIEKIADEVLDAKARANSMENASMQELNSKLKGLQKAFVNLNQKCKGQKKIRKTLQKKQRKASKELNELVRENMELKDHILATSPRKPRKKKSKKKRLRPWITGNNKTFNVPAKVSKKLRKKNMKPKKKKKGKGKKKKKVVKMPQICFGKEEIISCEEKLSRRRVPARKKLEDVVFAVDTCEP